MKEEKLFNKYKKNKSIYGAHENMQLFFLYLIAITFVIQNISCEQKIQISGYGNCIIDNKGSSFSCSNSNSCTNNCPKISLSLSQSTTIDITFSNNKFSSASYMFKNCTGLTSIDLSNFDSSEITEMNEMFYNCYSLQYLNFGNFPITQVVNMSYMFYNCSSLGTLDLSKFDTSYVLFMNNLFHDCISLASLDISNFNTQNVIRMESMFENCKSLTKLNLSNFYTPSVKQIYKIFSDCSSAEEIIIPNFDTFQITNFANLFYNCHSLKQISITHFVTLMASDISYMFYNCSKLSSLNLSNFNTERVVKMNSIFEGCSSLTTLIISNFKVVQVLDMGSMFKGCSKLSSFDFTIIKFNTSSVTNMKEMFSGCVLLKKIDLNNFKTENVINMNSMFKDCSSLTSLDIKSFNTSKVLDMSYMFYKCSSMTSIELSNIQTNNVEKIDSMFYDCKLIKSLSLITFNTSKIKSMKSTFHGCTFLEQLNLSHFDTRNVEYMDDLFYGCSSLIKLNISNFDISKVKLMSYMFYGCKAITSLILPKFNNLKVTNTSYMFTRCSSLTSLNLSDFDTSDVLSMDYMFSGCTYLKNLKLTNWDTRSVISMEYMFSGCSSLSSLDITSFRTPKLISTKGMFYGCSSIKFLDLSSFDNSLVTNMAYMFYKAISLTSLQLYKTNFTSLDEFLEENTYFKTYSLINMEYMFAYCSRLENIDLSPFNTSNVIDMSHMFEECTVLTSVNLSNFTTYKVTTMDYMFYKCLNLSYINLNYAYDAHISMDNILTDSLLNMVFCINKSIAVKLNKIIEEKNTYSICTINNCTYDYDDYIKNRMKLIEATENSHYRCVKDCQEENKYEEIYICHDDCPNGTFLDPDILKCLPNSAKPPPCTIQRVIVNNCTMEELTKNYTDSIADIVQFIDDLKEEIKKKFTLPEYIAELGIVSKQFFNITFQFTTLANKLKYENLTYLDTQDCENYLKVRNGINANEDLIIFKLEYNLKEFKIPAVEYIVYSIDGKKELNFSECKVMEFVYSYPVEINETEEFKYDPESDYNNEICFQYTTENYTDIILYDRRNTFNEYNLSLCENNCKYIGYSGKRVQCECPVKETFNKFLLEDKSVKDNLIFRFQNNHMQSFNFGVVKCFKILFSSKGFKGNYAAYIYLSIILVDIACALIFCCSGYMSLYTNIKKISEAEKREQKLKNLQKSKKENIITTGNNPPPKIIKDDLSKPKPGKKKDLTKDLGPKVNAPSTLIDSKELFQSEHNRNLSILNQFKENEAYIFNKKPDMEINMLPYSEALQKDKRTLCNFYCSFLKSRQLLIFIFANDNNSGIVKFCIFLFTFGICLGINTIFFDDPLIQSIYRLKGTYTIQSHITSKMATIIISAIITSILKSIIFLISLTDVSVYEINDKNNKELNKEEKISNALVKVTSKSSAFFIINFVLIFICGIYAGSFCAIFTNTTLFLLVSAGVSFGIVMLLPLFYCIIPAFLRKTSLNDKGKEKLYKFSQFFELI